MNFQERIEKMAEDDARQATLALETAERTFFEDSVARFTRGAQAAVKLLAEGSGERGEDFFLQIIREWKSFWMNQRQNSQADYENYSSRAMGVDANMTHHLASMLSKAAATELTAARAELEAVKAELDRYQDAVDRYQDAVVEMLAQAAPIEAEKEKA